jgi:hypothetical protein
MVEKGGAYAKWNMSDTDRQILYPLTYMCNLKRLIQSGYSVVIVRAGEVEAKWDVRQRVENFNYKMTKFHQSNAQHGSY